MLAGALRRLHESGRLPFAKMAEATGLDVSTFYPWLSGGRQPLFSSVQRLFQCCDDDEVRRELLGVFTAGSRVICVEPPEALDAGGEHDLDTADALADCAKAAHEVAAEIAELAEHHRDGRESEEQLARLEARSQHAIGHLAAAIQVGRYIAQHRAARRKCRPLVVTQ